MEKSPFKFTAQCVGTECWVNLWIGNKWTPVKAEIIGGEYSVKSKDVQYNTLDKYAFESDLVFLTENDALIAANKGDDHYTHRSRISQLDNGISIEFEGYPIKTEGYIIMHAYNEKRKIYLFQCFCATVTDINCNLNSKISYYVDTQSGGYYGIKKFYTNLDDAVKATQKKNFKLACKIMNVK